MTSLSNVPYDSLTIGQTARYSRRVEERDITLFAAVSGDVNPVHMDADFAAASPFKERIAHGMLTGAFISAALALELPGPGSVYLSQSLRFTAPVKIDDTVTVTLEVIEKIDKGRKVTLACHAHNQEGTLVVEGEAQVIAPKRSVTLPRPPLPDISIR